MYTRHLGTPCHVVTLSPCQFVTLDAEKNIAAKTSTAFIGFVIPNAANHAATVAIAFIAGASEFGK